MNYSFIRTTDKETKDVLVRLGFTEITPLNSKYYIFVNDKNICFSKNMKFTYTNIYEC